MKKITYLSALALGFALVACDNYKEPNPPAQYNPQEPLIVDGNVTAETVVDPSVTYDLGAMNTDGQAITLATVAVEDLAPGFTLGALAYISNDGFEESSVEIPAYVVEVVETASRADEPTTNFDVQVYPSDLNAAYLQFSKSPKEAEINIRAVLTAVSGNQVGYIGGPENYVVDTTMDILPIPSDMPIEQAYYLIGTVNGWDVATSVPFTHAEGNDDVYDNPIFYVTVTITEEQAEEGWAWKIIPQSTYQTGGWVDASYSQFAPVNKDSEAASGSLNYSLMTESGYTQPSDGKFTEAGEWKLTINMIELTFEFTPSFTPLYTPGESNGWNQNDSQLLTTTDEENYSGYAYLMGGFKFTDAPNWNGTNYGAGDEPGTLTTDGSAGNLTVSTAGLYWCTVNIAELTYTTYYVESYGIVGAATPGGWDNSTPLTPSADFLIWTGTVNLTSGSFKFRANNDWAVNLGGALDDLTQGGADLASPGEGTYEVTLNLSKVPYTATFVKK